LIIGRRHQAIDLSRPNYGQTARQFGIEIDYIVEIARKVVLSAIDLQGRGVFRGDMSKQEGGKKKNRSQESQKTLTKKARHKSSVHHKSSVRHKSSATMNGRRVKAISPPLQADPGETSNL
jgi:hypothetical protein